MTNPLFDLTGRTAPITGSSRGLGRAMAEGLAKAGANGPDQRHRPGARCGGRQGVSRRRPSGRCSCST